MAIIVDPDDLTQGTETVVSDLAFTASAGAVTTLTSTANLPAIAAGEYFAIRDSSTPGNNGLYYETGGSPTTSSITCTKITGANPTNLAAESTSVFGTTGAASELSVHYDTALREIYVCEQGNVSADGVSVQCLYSFTKEEWKNDDTLNAYDFPFISITPEQFEFTSGWIPGDDTGSSIRTRKVLRDGGWSEIDQQGILQAQYAGIKTLGSFEDTANDTAYYQLGDDPTDTTAATDFTFAGPVNESVLCYDQNVGPGGTNGIDFVDGGGGNDQILDADGGNFVTAGYVIGGQVEVANADTVGNNGTYTILNIVTTTSTNDTLEVATASLVADIDDTNARIAADNRNAFNIFIRVRDADPEGKTYDQSDLAAIGKTSLANQLFQFPLQNATDLDITETDANISTNSPYTEVRLRYLAGTYNREVDTTTKRDFGIVVDVGTYSQSNGASAASTLFTSASLNLGAGEALADYTGGTLIIHEGTDQGTHTISGTPVDNAGTLEITLTVALTATESNLSYTMERATPLTASKNEIYEKVQYQLRQAADIDETSNVVTGKTADELAVFVGPTLKMGVAIPENPNGGGSGVIIEGFDANDTNDLVFVDNGGTERTYPFVAAGTIQPNATLQADNDGWYIMFFDRTERFTNTGFGLSGASGSTATLDSSTTDLTAELASGDYIRLGGFANVDNNGVYRCTGAPAGAGPWTVAVEKYTGETVVNETAGPSVDLDKNPIDSPDTIIVDDNGGADIRGTTFGVSSDAFDFDYDGNVQGGRTAGTDAAIIIRFGGFDTSQNDEISGTITRAVGLSFPLPGALERNYDNP